MTDHRILRERQAAADAVLDRPGPSPGDGSTAMLAQTCEFVEYPIVARAYFACHPVRVDGDETEGTSASQVTDAERTFFAFNLGSAVPPLGTCLVVHSCGGRWTFRFDG